MNLIRNEHQIKPVFWQNESSGRMERIIKLFLEHRVLNLDELIKLRWYVHQWVKGFPIIPDDFEDILSMDQDRLNAYIWDELAIAGIDPF